MLPKNKVPEEMKNKRKKAFDEKRCCNHHSGDGFKIFPKVPRFSAPELKMLIEKAQDNVKLNDLQMSLAYIN